MYICLCNAVTHKSIKEAVDNGASTLHDLQTQLNIGTCCGCCVDLACSYLPYQEALNDQTPELIDQ